MKEGKVGRKDGQPLPGEDEPLHAFVTGNSNESVKKAVNKVTSFLLSKQVFFPYFNSSCIRCIMKI